MGTTTRAFALATLAATALIGMTLPGVASAQDYERYGRYTQSYGQSEEYSSRGYRTSNSADDQWQYNADRRENNRRGNERYGHAQETYRYNRDDRYEDDWDRSGRDLRERRLNYRHHHDRRWEGDDRGW